MKSKLFCFIIIAAVMSAMGMEKYVPLKTHDNLTAEDWAKIAIMNEQQKGTDRYSRIGVTNQYLRDQNKPSWDAWQEKKARYDRELKNNPDIAKAPVVKVKEKRSWKNWFKKS